MNRTSKSAVTTAGPVFILVAIEAGRALRKEQLGRAARIATWEGRVDRVHQ
jgi:hypothetical protein